MVSKPKPGLGKGLVRSIQHGQHYHSLPLPSAASGSGSGAGAVAGPSHSHVHAHASVSGVGAGAGVGDKDRRGGGALLSVGDLDRGTYAHAHAHVPTRRTMHLHAPTPQSHSLRHFTSLALPRYDYHGSSLAGGGSGSGSGLSSIPAVDLAFALRRDINATLSDFFPPPRPPSPSSVNPPDAHAQSPLDPAPISIPREAQAHLLVPSSSPSSSPPPAAILSSSTDLGVDTSPSTLPAEHALLSTRTAYASRFIFHFGASGLAKDRPLTSSSARRPRASNSPPPPPRQRSFPLPEVDAPTTYASISVGEDAYYARPDGMCVADGVGGWARSGRGLADAGRWSRLLTHFCEGEVRRWWAGKDEYVERAPPGSGQGGAGGVGLAQGLGQGQGQGQGQGETAWADRIWGAGNIRLKARLKGPLGGVGGGVDDAAGLPEGMRRRKLDPVEIMQRGFEKCLSCFIAEGLQGSSTCLLALLHHSTLMVANLGDCCLLVVRAGEIIFRTDEMQHAFNFPLQLGTHSRDEPMKDAKRYDVRVQRDDVVLVGSDGLMDNLFDEEIIECFEQFAPPSASTSASASAPPPQSGSTSTLPPFDPQKVSEALCRAARQKSEDLASETPFMLRAAAEGIDFVGGKRDDISVVVGVIGARGEDGKGTPVSAASAANRAERGGEDGMREMELRFGGM